MYEPISDERWQKGSVRELKFWRYWLSQRADEFVVDLPLRPYLVDLVVGLEHATIADIGSGAACLIGNVHPQIPVTIIASDTLADEYKVMWAELGKQPRIPVERQDMRSLTYPDNSFDVVYCANALDHCADPMRALNEMARVCKPRGWVYLRHLKEVGKNARYSGLHQWNVTRAEHKDLLIWRSRQDGNSFRVSQCLPELLTYTKQDWSEEPRRLIGIWRKP